MVWWDSHLKSLNGDRRVPIISCELAPGGCEVFLDARGGSGGVGVFANGCFVGLSGEQCNDMFLELSTGMCRTLGDGESALPSTAANHWELFAFVVLLRLFPEVIRNRLIVVLSDSVSACTCVQSLHAGVDCV